MAHWVDTIDILTFHSTYQSLSQILQTQWEIGPHAGRYPRHEMDSMDRRNLALPLKWTIVDGFNGILEFYDRIGKRKTLGKEDVIFQANEVAWRA